MRSLTARSLSELTFCTPFRHSERERQLQDLARKYHAEAEAYDRTVCTGPIRDGAIMPATPHELALIARNARAVRERIGRIATEQGFTDHELRAAIAAYIRTGASPCPPPPDRSTS